MSVFPFLDSDLRDESIGFFYVYIGTLCTRKLSEKRLRFSTFRVEVSDNKLL